MPGNYDLAAQALERPALIWSPFQDDETRGYPPVPVPGDPESPFGIVRKKGEHSWEELTGYEEHLTSRGYFNDALGGLIRDWRISHWWNDDPYATACLLCGAPNANHPEYRREDDRVQCQVIRDYTMDSHPEEPPLRRRMDELVDRDVEEILSRNG